MITPFADLDNVLERFCAEVREILGPHHIGTYLQGSFALGAGDLQSDADIVVVTDVPVSGELEVGLRLMHEQIPSRPGHWNLNLEGSYADAGSLRTVDGLGVPWLYADRGHPELTWNDHDNSAHTRWVLRHHGVCLQGPPVTELVDDVPADIMRAEARGVLIGLLDGVRAWADMDNAWTQRYLVQTACRVLCTWRTGEVVSKKEALAWGITQLDPMWRDLIEQVAGDRALPWQPVDPPRPGGMERAVAFAAHVEQLAQ